MLKPNPCYVSRICNFKLCFALLFMYQRLGEGRIDVKWDKKLTNWMVYISLYFVHCTFHCTYLKLPCLERRYYIINYAQNLSKLPILYYGGGSMAECAMASTLITSYPSVVEDPGLIPARMSISVHQMDFIIHKKGT